jgi:hypothetical protein
LAVLLAVVTAATKIPTGGSFHRAGLGVGLESKLAPPAAAYVLMLAVAGPLLERASKWAGSPTFR